MIINCKGIEYPTVICDCGRKSGLSTVKMHTEEYNAEFVDIVELERCDVCGSEYIFVTQYEDEFESGIILGLIK